LFLHGFWHGSWCWADVLARVTSAGVRALAVDMAGHGLLARRPQALTQRPFDPGLLATEASPVAGVDLDQAGELLISQMEQLGGGEPVVVVAHSMGGAVLCRAAQQRPELVAHAVYVAAMMPASGVPCVAYPSMPENEGSLTDAAFVANPAAVGALRIDVGSGEPAYRQRLRDAFYGDIDPGAADAAIALLSSDAPAGIALGTTTVTPDRWGSVPRTYVLCARDMTLRPALQRKFIADADGAFPGNPTVVHTLDASHSPFLSMPGQVADIALRLSRP
jgi:pimeloyl-ACP methyl ester carboxylesterase